MESAHPIDPEAWEARRLELERELGEPITVDGLSATWKIFQRRNGHRHSTDDLLTAWYALDVVDAGVSGASALDAALDLGTGIGTVGLLVLSGLSPSARLTCVEAQAISYRFLCENVRANGVEERVTTLHGDLRDLRLERKFALVTGSPPYFDVKSGIVPSDTQKAHARFELRGDVGDYARTARRHLTDDGRFVFCFPYAQKARAIASVRAEGFRFLRERDVVPREGLTPLFSVFACAPMVSLDAGSTSEDTVIEPPFVVRHADGTHTDALLGVRARFGWGR